MSFKNNESGFSFVEVLAALVIAALVLIPIFVTQGTMLSSVARRSRNLVRIFAAEQFMTNSAFIQTPEKTTITLEKKVDDPETFLVYEVKEVSKESVLGKLPDLYAHKVQARWKQEGQEKKESLVTFMFKPKPPEKKAEEKKATP